ncbi:MAG: NAD-dependent epimerase/dehydratase family protein, partial [Candidatus Moraniibacteriota bacterium]
GEAGVIAVFSEKMLRGEQPIIYDGKTTRDYVFVSDIVAANIAALDNGRILGVYNIGTGKETDVNRIFSLLNQRFDSAFDPAYLKTPVQQIQRSALSSEKFRNVSGWQPTVSLEEGIPSVVEWFRRKEAVSSQKTRVHLPHFAFRPSFFI